MVLQKLVADLGTHAVVAGLKLARKQVSKRQYKRLIATAVAQLLELHPDYGRRSARKRARQITGSRPSKKLMRAAGGLGVREGVEAAALAAASAGAAKVVGLLGKRVKERVTRAQDEPEAAENHDGPHLADAGEGEKRRDAGSDA
ncbi:MAG: hypothetical protein H0T44_16265 [Gemmatimonadales bacterium]|nr:hypothetical protein [Gemmatimonadales bacterium]